jgi:stearoyl-CoA desaturase (delta-9 desaturase)
MVATMALAHLLALLAVLPYFFSWTGFWLAIIGVIVSASGINVGYHRMLAHKGISCSKRVEHCLAVLGVLAYQFGPAYWVAIHRRHHQASDAKRDPHSPSAGFFWAHIGWLFRATPNTDQAAILKRYAGDLLEDPFYAWLEANAHWGRIVAASWLVYFFVGLLVSFLGGGDTSEAVQFGASLLVWGAAVRTVVVWHVTFAVNSVCHCWGYRNYATRDDSRNNPLVGIFAFGEGWHNNHHAFPRSARHGHRWWEFDLAWLIIKGLAALGLVKILDAGDRARGTARRDLERSEAGQSTEW